MFILIPCISQANLVPCLLLFLCRYLLLYTVFYLGLLVSDLICLEILGCCNHMLSLMRGFFFSVFFSAAAIGISFIQFSNNNSMRNHYVLGLALFLGISIPQYFVSNTTGDGHGPVRTNGGWVSHTKTLQAFSFRSPTFFGHSVCNKGEWILPACNKEHVCGCLQTL